ncbi:hypothetical protein KEM48_011391 [Puccinia striiformis f. sp. tritici PST-130]|nr:hypothetical protein KEM48_011391 [Puccinia striiformis f. sp. tritici PST-130]
MIFHPGALLVYGAVLALNVETAVQSPSPRSWRRLNPRGAVDPIRDLSTMEQATGHLGSALRGSKRINWWSISFGLGHNQPSSTGGTRGRPGHADSAVSSHEKEDAHAYIGRLSRLEPVTTKPPSIMASEKAKISPKYFLVLSKRLFKMDEKQRAGLEDWLQEKAGIEVWEGQPMEISELVDHTLDFLNQQNKVSLEYFTFAFRRLFKMDQKQRATLETWLQGQAGLKLLQGQHTESSVLADHTLKFLNQNKNTFSEWLGGEYEEMRKQSLAKEFDPVTLEESIEFYYPSIHEDQRQSVLRFALGLRVVEKEKPSLDHQWTLEDLKKLFKHWDDIAGPKKMTPWVTMSLKDFNEVTHKVLGFEPDVQDVKDNYFKSLLSWDLREEHQKFSLEELIHYTTLVMREEKILSGLWVWRNEIYFIDVQNMLMEQYLWHMFVSALMETLEPTIDLLGVNLFEAEKASFTQFAKRKLLSNKENFPLENLGAEKLAQLFHEWQSGDTERKETSLESKVLLGTPNGIQNDLGKESARVSEPVPEALLEDPDKGKTRLPREEEDAHAYIRRLALLEPVNTKPPSRTGPEEAAVSLKYFIVASKRLLKMDKQQTESLENWLHTLEESIEFYYPSINKDQRQAVLRFAEGLRADNQKEPSLDYRWTLKDLKKLFKHWDDIAGPKFNKHAPTIFTFDPVDQDDINNYLKSLLSWDIGDEHQKFSIEELIHYTTLAIKEREISVPDYVQLHSEVDFFFSSQDWRKREYLWKILYDTLVDFFKVKFLDDKQLSFARFVRQNFLSEDGNFPKENLEVDRIKSLLAEFTDKRGISLDSEVLPEDPNMTQHDLVAEPSPEKLLDHSDGGEMQTSSDVSSGEANAPPKPQWERNKELLEQLFRSHPTLSQEDKDSFRQFAKEKHVVEIDSGETLDFNRLQGWYKEWNGTQRRRPFMASLKNWWHRVLQFWQKILGLGKK